MSAPRRTPAAESESLVSRWGLPHGGAAFLRKPVDDQALVDSIECPELKAALNAFVTTHGAGTLHGNMLLERYFASTTFARNAIADAESQRFRETWSRSSRSASGARR